MEASIFLTAFINGLVGSVHCLGMCGPIVWIVQSKSKENWKTSFIYNFGRSISYTIMGGILGFFGWGMNQFFLSNFAFWLGIAFLLFLSFGYLFPKKFSLHLTKYQSKYFSFFIKQASKIENPNFLSLGFGIISGLLPCGLLYPAYGLAILTGSSLTGSLVMLTFSFGTFPMMFGLNLANQKLRTYLSETKFSYVLGLSLLLFAAYSIFYRFQLKENENCHTP